MLVLCPTYGAGFSPGVRVTGMLTVGPGPGRPAAPLGRGSLGPRARQSVTRTRQAGVAAAAAARPPQPRTRTRTVGLRAALRPPAGASD